MKVEQVWIAGQWRDAASTSSFNVVNPSTGVELPGKFPVSDWADCDSALNAAVEAARVLRTTSSDDIALFLESYASQIERSASEIEAIAHPETGLPIKPRLSDA